MAYRLPKLPNRSASALQAFIFGKRIMLSTRHEFVRTLQGAETAG